MRVVLRVLLVLIAIVLLGWFGGRAFLARSVPPREGTIVAGADAHITFDAKGIPQVWAKTDGDAYFAIGWLHASDRLFQMELVRRLARGELSEVFGEAAYEADVHQRRIGFARRANAAKLSPEARRATQRYVDGINAYIAMARILPPELVILRLQPRPWTLEDCLAISNYQTWFSHELMDQDGKYQKLIEKLGMPASALANAGHPWSPPTVPDLRITTASNSWVVAPSRSSSRAALHASDPHLSIDQAPGLWYLAGLHSEEGLNIVGVTYAGAPFVVMGHNDAIAFSFTVASVDLIDYYDDEPRSSEREEIRVKGEDRPRVLDVKHGSRGVMIDEKTSLYWAGFDFEPAASTDAALRLQKARNFDEFRRAVTAFGALDANWIYSDRGGNIGYQLGAPIPIRDHDTYVRQSATDPRAAWRGYRALEETPHALNPPQGFLASCNNQPVSREFPYRIPGFYDPYRITRAAELLGGVTAAEPRHMRAMQLDLTSGLAKRWKSLAADGARAAGLQNEAGMLAAWDARMNPDSRAATLFAAWWRRLPRAIFEDELGEEWDTGRVLLDEALTTRTPAIDDRRTPRVETIIDVSASTMREAVSIANGRTWGEACTLTIRHPLARVKVLDWFLDLNRGPFPGWGDPGALNANFFSYRDETKSFRAHIGPSMRFVLDWSDVDAFSLSGALGQSGNPFSPHYDDFLGVTEWNVPFTREKVFASAKSQVVMRR
ncbi:MAG: penicillin acylase family protein [Thermoanaerobaculia bacterium]